MEADRVEPQRSREVAFAAGYLVLLLAYLFVHPESELEHWLSLVEC